MSFLSKLSKIADVIHIGIQVAGPIISLIPGADAEKFVRIIVTAESVITQLGAGAVKADAIKPLLSAAMPDADQVKLNQAVGVVVGALNLLPDAPVPAAPPKGQA